MKNLSILLTLCCFATVSYAGPETGTNSAAMAQSFTNSDQIYAGGTGTGTAPGALVNFKSFSFSDAMLDKAAGSLAKKDPQLKIALLNTYNPVLTKEIALSAMKMRSTETNFNKVALAKVSLGVSYLGKVNENHKSAWEVFNATKTTLEKNSRLKMVDLLKAN